ncbi:hypothetical protein L1887_35913 [Cichorium endivia]|nr:hypothetical protein L1887_35913 [Cichorium endivia]
MAYLIGDFCLIYSFSCDKFNRDGEKNQKSLDFYVEEAKSNPNSRSSSQDVDFLIQGYEDEHVFEKNIT